MDASRGKAGELAGRTGVMGIAAAAAPDDVTTCCRGLWPAFERFQARLPASLAGAPGVFSRTTALSLAAHQRCCVLSAALETLHSADKQG